MMVVNERRIMEARPKSRLGADEAIEPSASEDGAGGWKSTEIAEIVLQRWAQTHQVPFVSVRQAFLAVSAADRARIWHGHYTPYGNGVVAKLIAMRLRALGGP
jgi:hypothetical protein